MAKKEKVVAPEGSAAAPAPEVEKDATPQEPKLTHNKKLSIVGDYTEDSKISWLIDKNPRSAGKGTFERFARYFGTGTVKEYKAASGTKGDLLWDLRAGYLSIEGVTLSGDPKLRMPKPKAEKQASRVRKVKDVTPEVDPETAETVATETID